MPRRRRGHLVPGIREAPGNAVKLRIVATPTPSIGVFGRPRPQGRGCITEPIMVSGPAD